MGIIELLVGVCLLSPEADRIGPDDAVPEGQTVADGGGPETEPEAEPPPAEPEPEPTTIPIDRVILRVEGLAWDEVQRALALRLPGLEIVPFEGATLESSGQGLLAYVELSAPPGSETIDLTIVLSDRRAYLRHIQEPGRSPRGIAVTVANTLTSIEQEQLLPDERDHDIPPLPELGRQLAVLQRAYDQALARHAAAPERPSPAPKAVVELPTTITSLAGIERGLSRIILDPQADQALGDEPEQWLRAQGVEPPDEQAMAAIGAPRLLVYRSLVRAGLRSVLRAFLPRTVARLGPDGLTSAFDGWLDEAAPRSRYLRDVPAAMVEWARRAWPADPQVPEYLVDLARLEVFEEEIDAAPDEPPVEGTEAQLVLDRPLSFTGALRIADFDHAIHTLPADVDDRTVPAKEPTTLLLYRDGDHEVRTLTLSPLARAVLVRLIDEGQTVSEAVAAGAHEVGEAVDGEVLGRLSTLLADLAERGVLRGSITTSS